MDTLNSLSIFSALAKQLRTATVKMRSDLLLTWHTSARSEKAKFCDANSY